MKVLLALDSEYSENLISVSAFYPFKRQVSQKVTKKIEKKSFHPKKVLSSCFCVLNGKMKKELNLTLRIKNL